MLSSSTPPWSLHPQLEKDGVTIADLALCRVLALNDANYPWIVLVPRRADARDIIDLTDADQARLTIETDRAARALRDISVCDKLNIAALGNMVPQLHIHIIARTLTDAAWPRPVWGVAPQRPYSAADLDNFVATFKAALQTRLGPDSLS